MSIGVVLSHGDDTPEVLLLAADRAMYQAKDAGAATYWPNLDACTHPVRRDGETAVRVWHAFFGAFGKCIGWEKCPLGCDMFH